MGRGVTRVTLALAAALLVGAGTAQAQNPITVEDARVLEQSSGAWTYNTPGIRVQIPGPPTANVTVNWTVTSGSATAGSDFFVASGTITFFALVDSVKYINTVQIVGDSVDEWSPTQQQDEVFFVELSSPSANATIAKGRATVTLVDDDRFRPSVQFLTAVSGGNISIGMNKLQWRIPGAQTPVTDVTVAWKVGPACTFPIATTDTAGGGSFSLGSAPGAGAVQTWLHTPGPAPNTQYCYSVFAIYGGAPVTGPEIANIKTKTFDATGSVAWTYATGSTSVVPPTVGLDAIYTTDNEGVVHAMTRGTTGGGVWPSNWNPVSVGKPTQNRSAVIPLNGVWRLLLGTDGGGVHMLDAKSGNIVWSRSASFGSSALPSQGGVQAPPGALLKGFGGTNDLLLVGTNNASNQLFALNLDTGATISSFVITGAVKGMTTLDYAANRVYFGTTAPAATFVALDLGPLGSPALSLSPPVWNPKAMGTGTNGAPVFRGGRVYLGDSSGQIHALHVGGATPGVSYQVGTGDGEVRGFLWPDRRDDRLYFAGNGKVQAVRDTGASLTTPIWGVSLTTPSMVLQWPGTDFLYVGDGTGRLVQIDVSDQSQKSIVLEAGQQIGPPSFDRLTAGQEMVIVGSVTGTIYAVKVPLP